MDRIFWFTYLLFIGFLLTVLAACGGGGGGNGGMAAPRGTLAGTWFGAAEDETGQLHSVKVTIADSRLTSFEVDGAEVGGASSPIAKGDEQMFGVTLTFPEGQLQIVMLTDAPGAHFAYVDSFFRFGVLQKDATALPAYATIDINGTWSGVSAFTDFAQFQSDPSSAICIVGTCSVTEVDARMTEAFTQGFDSVFGRWLGTSVVRPNTGPDVNKVSRAFVSPDKRFAGVWRCLLGANGEVLFPNKCTYSAWVKT
jgi:hypothetical protein